VSAAAPEKYHYVMNITDEMKGSKLDIDDLENAEYKMWHQCGGKNRGDDEKNEIVLSAFMGTCYLCNGQEHKATSCPKKCKGDNGCCGGGHDDGGCHGNQGWCKFMGTCNQCGKFGHMQGGCWELDSNKDKCPNGYRAQG
jgi:hypothetical protein